MMTREEYLEKQVSLLYKYTRDIATYFQNFGDHHSKSLLGKCADDYADIFSRLDKEYNGGNNAL
jgi:hypothetical protein